MSGKDKTLDSYERDRQLLLICHVKVMAKKKKKKKKNYCPTTTQKEK